MIDRYIRTRYRLLVILIVTVLVSTVAMVQNAYATEVEASGTCGESLTWELDSAGTLTISGTGNMYNYNLSEAPWYEYWTDIESIVISEGVTSISWKAFNHCSIAESITIPKSLKSIGNYAFEGCAFKKVFISDLNSYLSIPFQYFIYSNNPTQKGAELYLDGSLVEDLVIPDGITTIPYSGFWGCTSIKSVTIPEGVKGINSYAFAGCSNLKTVSFPKSLSTINSYAFSGCNNIEKLYISDLASYLSITYESGGNIYPLTYYGADLYIDNAKADTIVIPDTITHIGAHALISSNVKTVIIPEGIKSIGEGTFAGCKNLSSVTLPNSLKVIDQGAFEGCINLPSINIPTGVVSIGWAAFEGCSGLQTIYIPESVTSIGEYAFDGLNGREGTNGTFYVKKDSYAEQYLIDKGKNIEYYCFGNHVWDNDYTIDKEASCKEEGSKSIHCSVCDAIDEATVTVIPKSDHTYSDWKVTKVATCTEDGSKEKVCEGCDDKVTEVIPAVGHSFSEDYVIDTPASCTTDGSKSRHCAHCDEITDVTVIPATGHTFGEWVEVTASTCDNEGLRQHTCVVCGTVESENLDPKGHDFDEKYTIDVPTTCTTDGSQSRHCKNCDAVTDSEVIPKTGHDWNEPTYVWSDDKSKVTATRTCRNDSSHKESETAKTTSEVTKAATYTAKGDTTYTVVFDNEAFTKQTKTVADIPVLERASIKKATVSNIVAKVYNGKALTQTPTIKVGNKTLKSGTDYKLTYKNNKSVGKATITITGIGAYKGTISKTFKINPKPTTMSSIKAAKKGFTAKWKKQATHTTGYQIQYALNSKFTSGQKTVTITKNTTVSKKVTKLKAKKKYYVRVRTYKTVSGVKYYSSWSKAKTFTTK